MQNDDSNNNEINLGMIASPQPRTRSESPARSRRSQPGSVGSTMRRNPMMFMIRNPAEIVSKFAICPEPGCMVSSGVGDFTSMTIRTGLTHCTNHVSLTEVERKFRQPIKSESMTLIFYDIELSRDGDIEQIGACTESGQTFSAFVKTSVRTNSSPFLKRITPEFWAMLAEEPKVTFERFIEWTKLQHGRNPNSDGKVEGIMLAAHYGSCHDHVHLLRTMMKWGITPPDYTLVDTLAIFKTVKGMSQNAKLKTLVNKYAPWIDHVPHDANSDADALRYVTMIAFPNTKMACHAFGISCGTFMSRTGLNMYMPSPIVTFKHPNTDSFLEPRRRSDTNESETSGTSVSTV